ncbi:ribonuclease HII [bacterium]|nr:ribonuclease HII [bacterium]
MALIPASPGVIGMDEVGRGPLAGPVVACAFICLSDKFAVTVADSKQLNLPARQRCYDQLEQARQKGFCDWVIAEVDAGEIDRINILTASLLAMQQAWHGLMERGHECRESWVDGNCAPTIAARAHTLVKGDALRQDIAAASIIAKLWRDTLMARLDAEHPGYGWARNAGYGTALHMEGLARLGPSPYHRHSFAPVREALLKREPQLQPA